jgi:hypothetical protein
LITLCGKTNCHKANTILSAKQFALFENTVLRSVFGPKRDEVTGEWRRLHNEELNDLYSSPNNVRVIKSRRMRLAGHVARMRGGVYRVLVWKPNGKRPLGRPSHRWEHNFTMDLQEVGFRGIDLFDLSQDRNNWRALENVVIYILFPKNTGNFLTSCKPFSFQGDLCSME